MKEGRTSEKVLNMKKIKEKFLRGRFKLGQEQVTKMSHKGKEEHGKEQRSSSCGRTEIERDFVVR
jgi:hypothetical protein